MNGFVRSHYSRESGGRAHQQATRCWRQRPICESKTSCILVCESNASCALVCTRDEADAELLCLYIAPALWESCGRAEAPSLSYSTPAQFRHQPQPAQPAAGKRHQWYICRCFRWPMPMADGIGRWGPRQNKCPSDYYIVLCRCLTCKMPRRWVESRAQWTER